MIAFYPGSFNPFTVGHLAIVRQALEMFDHLVIGLGYNKSKDNGGGVEAREEFIRKIFTKDPRVTVTAYSTLTAIAAKEAGAKVLVRGVRNSIDFEKEKELADINLKVFNMPTIMIPSPPDLSFVSSSMVRELQHFGHDISKFIPDFPDKKDL